MPAVGPLTACQSFGDWFAYPFLISLTVNSGTWGGDEKVKFLSGTRVEKGVKVDGSRAG